MTDWERDIVAEIRTMLTLAPPDRVRHHLLAEMPRDGFAPHEVERAERHMEQLLYLAQQPPERVH